MLLIPVSFPLFTSTILSNPLPCSSTANCCSVLSQLPFSLPLNAVLSSPFLHHHVPSRRQLLAEVCILCPKARNIVTG